METKVRQKIW